MECRTKLGSLLRANAALRVLPPVSHRWIHFPPGPAASDDEEEKDRRPPSRRWFHAAYARLLRHAGSLTGVVGTATACPHAATRAARFNALAADFFAAAAASRGHPPPRMKAMSLSSLTRADMASLDDTPSPARQMAEQIASACTRFLSYTADAATPSTLSWLRPTPFKKPAEPPVAAKKWQEVLDMLYDLGRSLEADDGRLTAHAEKVEAMKEGLYQIRDVVIERDIAFKEARRQDCLVQRKLSRTLGHSSRCLYTLLLFYLYGTVRDPGAHRHSGDELVVRSGVKELSRALGVFRFVWVAANTECDAGKDVVVMKKNGDAKGVLELEGHLWGIGVEEKTVTYRGDVFHVH
ncbi:unnamed protein product [Urochloa decumbens]|uniref:Uncharacterized protein n=1 Tax=Urochloa decumbens TaxID=240449 RepID=A0ABC9AVR0_9POAL